MVQPNTFADMTRIMLLLGAFSLFHFSSLLAQCDIPPSTDNCENAPILCAIDDINGYCTSMSPNLTFNAPNPLCAQGGSPHNPLWFAFYAGCTSLNISLIPTNCTPVQGQLGIQAAIYGYGGDGICPSSNQTPDVEVACISAPCFSSPQNLIANNLTIGQIYYFMIDGCAGSYCDLEIILNGPCGEPSIDPWPQPIQGPLNICTGATSIYTVQPPIGAIEFWWYLDGNLIQDGPDNSVSITWTAAGTYELCVDASNQCVFESDNPAPTCITINVYDITPSNPPDVTICEDDTYPYAGIDYPPGTHEVTLKTAQDCDSIVEITIIPDPHVEADLGTFYLCPADIINVGGASWSYDQQGENEITITKMEVPNCDSTIRFVIEPLYVEPYIFPPDAIGCDITQVLLDGGNSVVLGPIGAIINYQWSASQGGVLGSPSDEATMTVFEPGKYCLSIEIIAPDGSNSCEDSICVIVPQVNVPNVSASVSGIITCLNPTVTLTGNSITPNVTFQWFGPGGNLISTNNITTTGVPGAHQFVVTDNTGCASTAIVVVTEDTAQPDVTAMGDSITCYDPTVNLTGSSNTPGVTYNWINSAGVSIGANPTVQAPGAGTFTLIVTNPVNGCKDSANAIVYLDTTLPLPTASTDTLTCNLTNPPLIGGANIPNPVYSWSFGGNPYSAQKDTVASASGNYTLTVFNPSNGCSNDTTIFVPENTVQPDAQALGDSMDCIKTTATLTGSSATPGATFQWTFGGNNAGNTAVINVSVPGIYSLLVTGLNGCTRTTTAEAILDADIPSIAISSSDDTINCTVTSIVLTGSSSVPVSYVWTNSTGQVLGNMATVAVTSSGTYSLVVTNPLNGCSNTTDISIGEDLVPPVITAVAGGTIDCSASTVNLSASSSTPGVIYQWFTPGGSPLPAGPSPAVAAAGVYTLVLTGYNGCTASDQATVLASPDLPQGTSAINDGPLTCTNTDVQIIASSTTSGVTYNWSGPGFTSSSASNTITVNGTYTVTITNPANGCTVTEFTTVTIDTIHPVLTPTGNLINCYDPNVDISVLSAPATGVTYQWTSPSSVPAGATPSINVNQSGNWTVLVTNTTNGCATSAIVPVGQNTTQPALPPLTATALTCTSPGTTIQASPGTTVTYAWTGPDINAGNQNIEDPAVALPGTYAVTITDPVNGCTNTASINVTEDKVDPVVQLSGGTIDCNQPSLSLAGISNPNTNISVQWFLDNNPIAGSTTTLNAAQSGIYTIIVTNTINGCTGQAQATVTPDFGQPDIAVTAGELTCLAPTLVISGSSTTPGVLYSWTGPGVFTSQTPAPQVTVPGNYILTLTAPNGCTSQATSLVTEDKAFPTAVASSSNIIDCTNLTTTLASTGSSTGAGIAYAWSGPNNFVANTASVPAISTTGTYTLIVTNTLNGCSATTTVVVDENQNLPTGIDVQSNDPRCFGRQDGSLIVTAVTGGTPDFLYSLNGGPFTPNPQFSGLGDGDYTLTVQDAAGCIYTAPEFTLTEPLELTVDLGEDFILQWGRDTFLYALISPPGALIQSITWTPTGIDTTGNTNEILIKPFNQTLYGITVVDQAGCQAVDKVLVLVEKRRPVYIPTAFAPQGEQNTRFYIQSGEGIEEIEVFEVFNRWGEQVFKRENFQPNDPSLGWDGNIRNRPANPEVFVYYAKIRFNDGITILYKGDVTLLR